MQTNSLNLMVNSKNVPKRKKKKSVVQTKAVKKQAAKKPVAETITYRPRTAQDDAFIVSLTQSELGEIHQQSFGQPFPAEQFRRYIESGAPTVVIERNGKPVGYYSYLVSPDGKMHVSAMVIDPKHQNAGIGKKAVAKLEEDARKMGVHTMEVFVQESNAQSLAFARSLGFREVFRVEPNTIGFHKYLVTPQTGPIAQPSFF
ncbi:GNAT family N-acetyltransferase [Alicyclobacillus acidiphilus]|uniref:GNAT family N-acetyltransferase n=1 Tax=Alicyclobacillus acidiphilus TaxID=182455 RepID=UPI0009F8783B|nr:GNAT family N-acetyltransferase [Alicyclobacillus acidiphilus]